MLANNNLKICRTLVWGEFRFHRVKNLFFVLAAALVTALYSFAFLLGSSVEQAFLLSYRYHYGSACHILYTGLTGEQADVLLQNPAIKSAVRLNTVGRISDPMIGQRAVELAVADIPYAETVLSVPEEGRMPEEYGEIALDEFTMDSLGVLHRTGAPVTLQWTDVGGREHTSVFRLCGWWAGSANYAGAYAWISQDTAGNLAPGYGNAANVTLGVNLHRPENLEAQADAVLAQQGIEECGFTANLEYNDERRKQARKQAMPFYGPVLPVVLCGYLMIYGIAHASAGRDALFFAGLKSLGMTPRQLRRMLLEQGSAVALLGLLPGWALGFGMYVPVISRVIVGMEENPALYFLSWKPFAAAAFGTFLTVLPAFLLPSLRLSGRTPAQAVRSVSAPASVFRYESVRRKLPLRRRMGRAAGGEDDFPVRPHGGDGHLTLVRMALRTLAGSKVRTLLSAVWLLLAAVLLSSVWIRYVSLKEDRYLSAVSPWDYSLTDGSAQVREQVYNEKSRSLTEETVEELRNRPEVVSVSVLKSREVALRASGPLRRRIVDYYNQSYDGTRSLRDTQKGYPEWCEGLDRLEREGTYTGLVIGMDGAYLDYVLEYSPFTSGGFDENAFASGNYVLAAGAYHEGVSTQAAGETVELGGREFTVMGSVGHDDSYLNGSGSREADFHIAYLMPVEAFDRLFPGQGYRQIAVTVDSDGQAGFETYLDEYGQGLNRGVGIVRRSEYRLNFRAARLNMVLPGLAVGLVLSGIALLNFVNMLAVKTVGRKEEFAVYESLGMDRLQLRRLVLLEGGFHALYIAVILIPVTLLFDCFAMPEIIRKTGSWSSVYTFSALPLWVFVTVSAALAVAVPLGCLHGVTRGSLHDRMRGD